MIDHTGIAVPTSIYEKTKAFYEAALEPLGYKALIEPVPNAIGLGPSMTEADFWINGTKEVAKNVGIHTAFRAKGMDSRLVCLTAAVLTG